MNITVEWKDAAANIITNSLSTFAEGEVYGAVITLTAKNGYSFDPAIHFQYPYGVAAAQTGDDTHAEDAGRTLKRSVAVIYNSVAAVAVDVDTLNPASHIFMPVAGERPVWSFAGPGYTGTVTWNGLTPGQFFLPETAYRAVVALYAGPKYTFTGTTPVYTGGTVTVSGGTNTGASITGIGG
jgi:hypothetical protein